MRWETIRKDTPPRIAPNLGDDDEECAGFSWSEARARLEGLPGGRGLNIAHEAVDRHAASTRATAVALRCVGRDDSVTCVTYADLARSDGTIRQRAPYPRSVTATWWLRCWGGAPAVHRGSRHAEEHQRSVPARPPSDPTWSPSE